VLLALAALSAGAAAAAPVQIGYDQVPWETSEDFQGLAPGGGGGSGPVFYDGFSVETGFEYWALVSDEPPCSDANRCLRSYISPLYSPVAGTPIPPPTARFTNFPVGTRSFGIRLPGTFAAYSGSVVGASGTLGFLTFTDSGEEREYGPLTMAFTDPGGISSFSITGPAEYDDVVTSPAAIPLPPAGVLLLLALGALGLAGRRRAAGRG
jgi:hypothetical protein